jgi:hypothetical protein
MVADISLEVGAKTGETRGVAHLITQSRSIVESQLAHVDVDEPAGCWSRDLKSTDTLKIIGATLFSMHGELEHASQLGVSYGNIKWKRPIRKELGMNKGLRIILEVVVDVVEGLAGHGKHLAGSWRCTSYDMLQNIVAESGKIVVCGTHLFHRALEYKIFNI